MDLCSRRRDPMMRSLMLSIQNRGCINFNLPKRRYGVSTLRTSCPLRLTSILTASPLPNLSYPLPLSLNQLYQDPNQQFLNPPCCCLINLHSISRCLSIRIRNAPQRHRSLSLQMLIPPPMHSLWRRRSLS